MKKTMLKLLFAFSAVALIFSSCEQSTDPQPPTITLAGGSYIDSDAEITVGSTFMIKVVATPNTETESKLVAFSATRTFENTPTTVIDTTLDKLTSFTYELVLSAQATTGTERIVIEVEDKDGEVAEAILNITYVGAPTTLSSFTTVLLGAQNSSEASCGSLETGETFTISGGDASSNSASIDIVHYNGAKDVALYSPSNSDIQSVTAYNISSWATINDTKLSLTSLTAAQFDGISTNVDLEAAGTPSGDAVGLLEVGDVVVFLTEGGKKGVFKVADVNDAANGSVTIDIKVEP